MSYIIINEVLGTTIEVDTLPDGVRVGETDIGPSYNNRPPPKLIVRKAVRDWLAGDEDAA